MQVLPDSLRLGAASIGVACVGIGAAAILRRSDASSAGVVRACAAASITAGALLLAVTTLPTQPNSGKQASSSSQAASDGGDCLEAMLDAPPPLRRRSVPSDDRTTDGSAGMLVTGDASRRRGSGSNPKNASATAATTRRGPVIVGVGGASGSGKTSIAELIAARLGGMHVVSLSSDNYYKTLPHDVDPSDYNFDHPSAIDFDRLADDLTALQQGHDAAVPNYDFVSHARTSDVTHISGTSTDVLILDGIFVLYADRVRELCDLTIFTAEDSDVCLARRLRRDIVARGRTVDSVLLQYLRFVKAGYTQFVAPSMTLADVIIPRARDNEVAIDMLARDLQRRVMAS